MEEDIQINQQDDITDNVIEMCIDDSSQADDTATVADEPIAVFVPEEEGYMYIEDEVGFQCNGRCTSGWCSTCDDERNDDFDHQAFQEWIEERRANLLERTFFF
jgi:hypothetical protein